MDDAIPICRSVLKNWVYEDAEYFKVWFTMLADASYSLEPKTILYDKVIAVQHYGEFVFGRKRWNKKTGVSEQRLRQIIKLLTKDRMIEVKTKTSKFTIYKIVKYENFNQQPSQTEQGLQGKPNPQTTSRQPADNQQTTTTKKVKKDKKEKNNYSEYVKMTSDEYKKLVDTHGEDATKQMIEILDNYKGSKGKTYVDDYRAILSWVVKRYEEDQTKKPKLDETEIRRKQAMEFDRRNGLRFGGNGKAELHLIES